MLSLRRGATFYKNGMTRPGAQNGAQNDPQKHAKTAFGAQWSLGDLQGTLWGAFGIHFGLI